MADFVIKQNDTSPIIVAFLQDEKGNAVDISGADVQFHMADYQEEIAVVDEQAVIEDALNGEVSYNWKSGDTLHAETYKAEFEVTFADGAVETFPNKDYIIIEVEKELA